VLLHGVVGQVHHPVSRIVEVVFLGRCPDVAVVVPVALETSIDCRDEDIASDIELSTIY
jgi:hypothetical protein